MEAIVTILIVWVLMHVFGLGWIDVILIGLVLLIPAIIIDKRKEKQKEQRK